MDPTVITEIADYFSHNMNYHIPPRTPFVGEDFNKTRAGIHADGMLKDEEIYNIFDTGAILNRPAGVTVSATSGTAGIAYWINSHYRLTGDDMVTKKDPLVIEIKKWVDEQYANGRQTVISTVELEKLIVTFKKDLE
jgi:isopropylmalate/homocitrate/citramalate synthase